VRPWPGDDVLAAALALVGRWRWVAYELVYHHPTAPARLDSEAVETLGAGLDSWGAVDAFGRYISGPAWQRRAVPDQLIQGWTASPDRWWRRAALVSTVPLNLRAAGGEGDTERTLDICVRLVDDGDDLVVKALSWALRALSIWDADAVRRFLSDHEARLAARVRREVTSKLDTGRKQRRP
jgi:3-methyladenine DNA glycosylase AlkD